MQFCLKQGRKIKDISSTQPPPPRSQISFTQYVVAFSTPVSTLYARNAWDYDPPYVDDERPAFYDSGFPTEARVNRINIAKCN